MSTRRSFIQGTVAAALTGPSLAAPAEAVEEAVKPAAVAKSGSDVGSLYPFIQSQVVEQPTLSYLRDVVRDVPAWKGLAR